MFYDIKQNPTQLSYSDSTDDSKISANDTPNIKEIHISQEDAKSSVAELLELYSNENSKIGYLIFQVSTALGTLPVPDVRITVSKLLGDGYFLSKVISTDIDGKTAPIALPTVNASSSQLPGLIRPYSTYDATLEAPGFFTVNLLNIPMFENVTAVQPVTLFPDMGLGGGQSIQEIYGTGPQI